MAEDFTCPQEVQGGCGMPKFGRAGACMVCKDLWPKLRSERELRAQLVQILQCIRGSFTLEALGAITCAEVDRLLAASEVGCDGRTLDAHDVHDGR